MGKTNKWFTQYLQATQGTTENMKADGAGTIQPTDQVVIVEDEFEQLAIDLGIPKQLRAEFNFLKLPFFDLGGDSKRTKIEINESVVTPEGTFQILWRVTRNIESAFPGEFEKRVHRAIEQILNATAKPIVNPLRLGSIYSIAKRMGINADSGKNYESIQRALKNIVKTSVEAKGTFQVKESKSKRSINDTFHLYDRVVFRGEELPEGTVADAIYLWLGSWYLQNINHNYVVPLDWHFYNQLQGSITTRMYEFLSIHFFVMLEQKRSHYDVRYSEICNYFPLVRQSPGWKARKQLKQAHESLVQKGYFAKVEWIDVNESDDWLIQYWIGQRARDEYEANKAEVRQIGENVRPVPIPERRRRRQIGPGEKTAPGSGVALNVQISPLENELNQEWGVTATTTQKLLKTHPEARIREVVAWAQWAKTHKPKLIGQNPAGWIRKALEENWAKPPAGYVSEDVRKAQREKERQAELAKEAAKDSEWQDWLNKSPEERVRHWLEMWAMREEKLLHRLITKEEILAKEKELIAREPFPREKQMQIFGYVKYPEQV